MVTVGSKRAVSQKRNNSIATNVGGLGKVHSHISMLIPICSVIALKFLIK